MSNIINDPSTFEVAAKDLTCVRSRKLIEVLMEMKRKDIIMAANYKLMYYSDPHGQHIRIDAQRVNTQVIYKITMCLVIHLVFK
ncbi:hypothetical protein GJ496_012002 [Pomphorhynchus laevis]|nr:hypothetical protein GJ496_012002 [Pomphorhynchus laevis]